MAVSINSVYQKVLTIANKEQRGYVTPVQFNLLANQAQENIFSQYFYDLNQFYRVKGNDSNNADQLEILKEKIAVFETSTNDLSIKPLDFYKVSDIVHNETNGVAQHLTRRELNLVANHPLTAPTTNNPVYTMTSEDWVKMSPQSNSAYIVYYIRKPKKVKWGYNLLTGADGKEAPLYNSNTSSNFELHNSEEPQLVNQLLQLVGIMIKDPTLYQTSSQEEMKKIQQEKQ